MSGAPALPAGGGGAARVWWTAVFSNSAAAAAGRAAGWIARLAERADLLGPHALLVEALGGTGEGFEATGRARLLARLGPDAAEPLDELLNAAMAYERAHPPSLQGFVHWLRHPEVADADLRALLRRQLRGGPLAWLLRA